MYDFIYFSGSESGSEQSPSQPVSLDAITTVSLLLVELISPDVMYNGLPWPEEEFCKVLYICECISELVVYTFSFVV